MSAWTTQALLRAQDQGARITVRETGSAVVHDPRRSRDRQAWRLKGGTLRYTAAECRAEGQRGGPWALAKKLRIRVP